MAKLDFGMGKMVGPLPMGAWLAIIAVGTGIALYRRSSTTDSTVVDDTSGQIGVGDGTVGGWISTTPTTTDVGTAPVDNDAWGRLAINYLIAQGYDAAVSDSAIRKYLAAEKLSSQEYALVRIALRHLGATPLPLPPPVFAIPVVKPIVTPPPTAPKPVPKPTIRYYTVVRGDTLSKISVKYYHTSSKWPIIYNANKYGVRRADGTMGMIRNANLIQVGWRLIIP